VDVHYERGNLTIRGRVRRPTHEGSWALEEYPSATSPAVSR